MNHKSTILNKNFIQEKPMMDFHIVGSEAWDSVATRSEHQTDHKVQVKGIMVDCYFGIVFNRSSQLDHWSLCGSPPL